MHQRRLPVLLSLLFIVIHVCAFAQDRTYDIQTDRGITYATSDHTALQLDLYRPLMTSEELPVVLAIHGGFWQEGKGDREEMRPVGEWLASKGYAVVAVDYRLLPRYTFPAPLEDVRSAARWIAQNAQRYHFDAQRIVTFGVSAGGQLAALLAVQSDATSPRMVAAVTLFGPTDFTQPPNSLGVEILLKQYLGVSKEENPQVYAQASPITFVTPNSPPFLLIHGTKDRTVPYAQSVALYKQLQGARVPVTLYTMDGIEHDVPAANTPMGQRIRSTILGFLAQWTGSKQAVKT